MSRRSWKILDSKFSLQRNELLKVILSILDTSWKYFFDYFPILLKISQQLTERSSEPTWCWVSYLHMEMFYCSSGHWQKRHIWGALYLTVTQATVFHCTHQWDISVLEPTLGRPCLGAGIIMVDKSTLVFTLIENISLVGKERRGWTEEFREVSLQKKHFNRDLEDEQELPTQRRGGKPCSWKRCPHV